jgi:glutaminyl-tRNA synthetase
MEEIKKSINFIEEIIDADIASGHKTAIQTRFPPEPNGYLHIGHAKSICLNFGLAQQYQGKCNLRFDDTNPAKESQEYVDSIKKDVQWLGFQWDNEFYASDYFEKLYQFALQLIQDGNAYIDNQSPEKVAQDRGVPTRPGTESPFRNRPIEESVALFEAMRNGKYEEKDNFVLRAKIDMASPNMHMRDPIMYRVRKVHHHRTGNDWCIYPMYDFAHGLSDAIETISHSICTLEFEVHRPLYNWFNEKIFGNITLPQQIEMARLNLGYTVMSKRKLLQLVEEKLVDGWDDPRMPTISGLRRRGYTPASIRNFCETIGVARRDGMIDVQLLEHHIREDLNKTSLRRMAVLDPIKVVITNYPANQTEKLAATNNPEDETAGKRKLSFSNEIYIEKEDFMENAPEKFFRLAPGKVVRLKYAYIIQCNEIIKDEKGEITELRCEYFENSKSGQDTSGIKCKGTIHWVNTADAIEKEIYLYDRLLTVEDFAAQSEEADYKDFINPESLLIVKNAKLEPALAEAKVGQNFQFERKGYFCADSSALENGILRFNRTVALKDSWAKEQKKI